MVGESGVCRHKEHPSPQLWEPVIVFVDFAVRQARQIFGGNAYTKSGLGEKAPIERPCSPQCALRMFARPGGQAAQ